MGAFSVVRAVGGEETTSVVAAPPSGGSGRTEEPSGGKGPPDKIGADFSREGGRGAWPAQIARSVSGRTASSAGGMYALAGRGAGGVSAVRERGSPMSQDRDFRELILCVRAGDERGRKTFNDRVFGKAVSGFPFG